MKRGGIILIIFGLFWSGMVLMFDLLTIKPALRQVRAQSFSTTDGIILSSEVTHDNDGDGTTHGVKIAYTYQVAGRELKGDRYRYGNFKSSDSAWARQAVREHPVGSKTTVYYNPFKPEDAVLKTGLAGSDLFMAMFMTPFNAVMLGIWWFGWSKLRCLWNKPVAGGVKVWTELRQTRARLNQVSPLVAALALVAGLAFLSIFVVAFGFGGFHPSLRVMKVAWTSISMVGVAAGLWHWKDLQAGKYDLIMDELNGTLQLPRTCGRKVPQKLTVAAIQDVVVETVEKRDSEGDTTYTYIPALRLNGEPSRTEKLVQWTDAEKAGEFAAWLREKLGCPRMPPPTAARFVNGNPAAAPKKN